MASGSSNNSSNSNSIIHINNELNSKVLFQRPNIEALSSMLANHLKFKDANNNLNDKVDVETEAKKTENALNGILKNSKNSSVSHQKNISFQDADENLNLNNMS